ncbi:MAG: ECF-type sigma factor [Casimicrobium sp.]
MESEFETVATNARDPVTANDTGSLFAIFYQDLKQLARSRLRTVGGRTILDTTMLVHDTYERLASSHSKEFPTRGQFMAYCAHVMRSVIVDLVRANLAQRRGGGDSHVTLNTEVMREADTASADAFDVLRVHEALAQLRDVDPHLEQIVELRYFAGLTEDETAAVLGISDRTVTRHWERARALLRAILDE